MPDKLVPQSQGQKDLARKIYTYLVTLYIKKKFISIDAILRRGENIIHLEVIKIYFESE